VNVALGVWWRRQGARGNLEWIEAGGWQKAFEYVSHPGAAMSQTSYIAPESARPRMNIDGLLLRGSARGGGWIGSTLADPLGEASRWLSGDDGSAPSMGEDVSVAPVAVMDPPERMERGVVWLG
jgi:hypothetical protein